MTADGDQRYRFGDCELDLATRELRRDGEPVALQPRVFNLLAFHVVFGKTVRWTRIDESASVLP